MLFRLVSHVAACLFLTTCFIGCIGQPGEAAAQAADEAAAKSAAEESSSANAPDPKQLVREMADFLGDRPEFVCEMKSVVEITASGMENRMATESVFRLQRPDRVALVLKEGTRGLTVVSDGETMVQYVPALQRYTRTESPGDIGSVLANPITLAMSGGTPGGSMAPFGGPDFYEQMMTGVTGTSYVGTEELDGVKCHRCRFEQAQFNWDLWIQAGDQPLPRKVTFDLSDQLAGSNPMFKNARFNAFVTYSSWDLDPELDESDFRFEPPDDAEEVDDLLGSMLGGAGEGPHPLVGEPAPEFKTETLDGEPLRLAEYLGSDVVILDFWATWCPPCVEALPKIAAVAEEFADRGVTFFAVNVDEEAEAVREFLKDEELDVPVAMDPGGEISQRYQANAIPQTVLIGKDGTVQVVHVGMSGDLRETLSGELEKLLAGEDLAKESLAAAERSEKPKRQAAAEVKPFGTAEAWSVEGDWTGVAAAGDGKVVAVTRSGRVATLNAAGKVMDESRIEGSGMLRLADLVEGGSLERLTFRAWGDSVRSFGDSGEELWSYSVGAGIDDVWAADISGDDRDEVIVGYNGNAGLHVLDHRGVPLWKYTNIGNVWHVTAGDVNDDEDTEVVSTSAAGSVHVFDAEGAVLKEIQTSIYANMVRVAPRHGNGPTASMLVGGSGQRGETLLGLTFDGDETFSRKLPTAGTDHIDDLSVADDHPWAAVSVRGGLIHAVDTERGEIIATVSVAGPSAHVAWLDREGGKTPLLVAATADGLSAFEVKPDSDGG